MEFTHAGRSRGCDVILGWTGNNSFPELTCWLTMMTGDKPRTAFVNNVFVMEFARGKGFYRSLLRCFFNEWDYDCLLTEFVTCPSLGWKKLDDLGLFALTKADFNKSDDRGESK